MPLDEEYGPQIYSSNADLCNVRITRVPVFSPPCRGANVIMKQTGGRPGGSCTAALFLKAFVEGIEAKDGGETPMRWAHIDIAGTMEFTRPSPYSEKGLSGRPVR